MHAQHNATPVLGVHQNLLWLQHTKVHHLVRLQLLAYLLQPQTDTNVVLAHELLQIFRDMAFHGSGNRKV